MIAYPPKLLCGQTAYSSENLTLAAKEDIPQVINTLNCLSKFKINIYNFFQKISSDFEMIIHIKSLKISNMFPIKTHIYFDSKMKQQHLPKKESSYYFPSNITCIQIKFTQD